MNNKRTSQGNKSSPKSIILPEIKESEELGRVEKQLGCTSTGMDRIIRRKVK